MMTTHDPMGCIDGCICDRCGQFSDDRVVHSRDGAYCTTCMIALGERCIRCKTRHATTRHPMIGAFYCDACIAIA